MLRKALIPNSNCSHHSPLLIDRSGPAPSGRKSELFMSQLSLLALAVNFCFSGDWKVPQGHLLSQDWCQTGLNNSTTSERVRSSELEICFLGPNMGSIAERWTEAWSIVLPAAFSLPGEAVGVVSGKIHSYFWVLQDTVQKRRCRYCESASYLSNFSFYVTKVSMLFVKVIKGSSQQPSFCALLQSALLYLKSIWCVQSS